MLSHWRGSGIWWATLCFLLRQLCHHASNGNTVQFVDQWSGRSWLKCQRQCRRQCRGSAKSVAAPVWLSTCPGRQNTLYPTRVGRFNQHTWEAFVASRIYALYDVKSISLPCQQFACKQSWNKLGGIRPSHYPKLPNSKVDSKTVIWDYLGL